MQYGIKFKIEAERDLARLSSDVVRRVLRKIDRMRNDLAGDVKRLVRFTPGLRLRVGDWRVLFSIENDIIVVWRVVHRSAAYE
ncbi:MAG TPA: type II toxin-antitoxin system RelE/ParE family toxin [Tepidisphaeraceae bacterium]|nr:type II toxin-antitoxin system RelE/ParE family toxin [Tepidisphaeraceae bacterium]